MPICLLQIERSGYGGNSQNQRATEKFTGRQIGSFDVGDWADETIVSQLNREIVFDRTPGVLKVHNPPDFITRVK